MMIYAMGGGAFVKGALQGRGRMVGRLDIKLTVRACSRQQAAGDD